MGYLRCQTHIVNIWSGRADVHLSNDQKIVAVSADTENLYFHSIAFKEAIEPPQPKILGWCLSPNSSFSYDDQNYIPKYLFSSIIIPHKYYIKDVSINSKPQISKEPDASYNYHAYNNPGNYQVQPQKHRLVSYNQGYEHIGPVELIPTNDNQFYGQMTRQANQIIHVFELEPWSEEVYGQLNKIL